MKPGIKMGVLCASTLLSAAPLSAQSNINANEFESSEARVMVGFTIPFGGNRRAAQAKPRFDLTVERAERSRRANEASHLLPINLDRQNIRRATLSWTIEEQPSFMLNGQMLQSDYRIYADGESEDNRGERSTGKKILRGAAVAGGLVVVAVGVGIALTLADCRSDDGCGD